MRQKLVTKIKIKEKQKNRGEKRAYVQDEWAAHQEG